MRYYLISLGCPKNAVDAEGMGTLLHAAGHQPVFVPEKADVLLVNTCGFIAPARAEDPHSDFRGGVSTEHGPIVHQRNAQAVSGRGHRGAHAGQATSDHAEIDFVSFLAQSVSAHESHCPSRQ